MKLYGLTFTYNESTMIPYVMKYLEHMGFDKLIVYDNQSSDNTVELLKKYPFVEVRTLDTGGSKSNQKITELKNSVWKEFRNEEDAWMFISDFDEAIYYGGDLKDYLSNIEKDGYNYLNQDMMQTICEHFPDKDKFVHEACDGGIFWGSSNVGGCKMTLFKISDFNNIDYVPGAHRVFVTTKCGAKLKSLNNKDIKSFHLKYIDKNYCVERKNLAKNRRGPNDVKMGYGIQYTKSDNEFIDEWNNMYKQKHDVSEYVCGKISGSDGSNRIIIRRYSQEETNPIKTIYGDIKISNFKRNVIRKKNYI